MRLSLAIAAAVTAALAGSAGATTTAPRLVIEGTAPLVLHGSHFKTAERVRVTGFAPGGTATRTVTATRTGTFVVRFASLNAGSCGVYGAHAVGNRGSKAAVRFAPPECAPGPTSP